MPNYDLQNLFGVKDLVVVITGGGSGLGLYIAKALDANGAKAVYIIGRREETLKKAASEATNGKIIPLVGDVTSKDSLKTAAEQVKKEQGYINALFANSGIIGPEMSKTGIPTDRKPTVKEFADALWKTPMEDFTQTYHVNVTGVFYTCLAFLELLDEGNRNATIEQKSNIVITSSIAGFSRVAAAGFPYASTKAGVTHMTKSMATYFGDYKIRVNGIAPGVFPSEMTAGSALLKGDKDPREEGAIPKNVCPMERSGREEEMAAVALHLVSKGGAYLSGNIIIPDGGRLSQQPATY